MKGKGGRGSPFLSGNSILNGLLITISTSAGFKNTFIKGNLS